MRVKIGAILLLAAFEQVTATSLVVDSFTEAPFDVSLGEPFERTNPTTPYGTIRDARLSDELAGMGTSMTSALDAGMGTVSLNVDGNSISSTPLHFSLSYIRGGVNSLLGSDAIELDFSNLSGMGFLIVELGSQSSLYGSGTNRVAINGPGTVSVSSRELNFGVGGSLDSFTEAHFTFEAASEQFSFTLDEISVVPEPSSALLLGFGGLLAACRRRRSSSR